MSDPVFLAVTGTETITLGHDPHALAPGRRVTLTIDGAEVAGRIAYAEAAVWDAGKVRVAVDGEERTRIVDAGDAVIEATAPRDPR